MTTKVSDLRSIYNEALSEANDWFEEGKEISRYIFPKNGRFDDYSNPIKRAKDKRKYIVNPVTSDAFAVLVSGIHGRLTGQHRHWCRLDFANTQAVNSYLKGWLYDCQVRMHKAWNISNFYEVMPIMYKECAGFGTAAVMISDSDRRIFTFDALTFGEYVFIMGSDGMLDKFFRKIEMSIRQLELNYGRDRLPESFQDTLKDNKAAQLSKVQVIQCVFREKYRDKPIKSVHFLDGVSTASTSGLVRNAVSTDPDMALRVAGFYEWPTVVPRWDIIGSYPFGSGLGAEVLPFTKRLQEMEKAFLMATHKAVNPPYNIPSRMRGTVSLLPGAYNYSSDPKHKIEPILNGGFEYMGVSNAAERVENAIRKMLYNDVFITASRDPNASPLKARQVDMIEDEGILRLNPVVGRLYQEALSPIVSRCFNSMLRRGLFAPIDPEMLKEAGGIDVTLIGPLAQQQKLVEVKSIQTFFSFMAGIIPFDDRARDKVNVDRTIDEVADMLGAPAPILATPDELKSTRDARAKAAQAAQAKEDAVIQGQMQNEGMAAGAGAVRDYAAAGVDISSVLGGQ